MLTPYVRNAWYVASWNMDLETARPLAVSILDEPIVQDVLRELDANIFGRLHPEVFLCATELLPSGEPAAHHRVGGLLLAPRIREAHPAPCLQRHRQHREPPVSEAHQVPDRGEGAGLVVDADQGGVGQRGLVQDDDRPAPGPHGVDGAGIPDARLEVGEDRPSAQNAVLQP